MGKSRKPRGKNKKTIIKDMIVKEFNLIPGYVVWLGKENGKYVLVDKKNMICNQIFDAELALMELSKDVREYLQQTKTTEAEIWIK
jgi:ribonuclease HIII